MKKLIISITLLLIATPLISAEIIPVWHKQLQDGIQDIELLKGGDEFMLIAGLFEKGQIQIRNAMDGELIRSHHANLDHNGQIVLTPDSTRFILISNLQCELRNLDDTFSIVNSFDMGVIFTSMAIDPSRPYIYVAGAQLRAYNYETGEMVKEFTGYIADAATKIDVSADGRYLATLNDGKAYLKVWDLSTMELIRDVQLWDSGLPNTDWWCESKDVQFSKLNSDVVYYSGYFPTGYEPVDSSGVIKFHISNQLTETIKTDYEYAIIGRFILFDNENRMLVYSGVGLDFLNIENQKIELSTTPTLEYPLSVKSIFSKKNQIFIGFSGQYIGAIKYDRGTSVESPTKEIIVSPNPTGSFINVSLECSDPQINYQISDINGLLISEGSAESHSGNLQIDFSPYPAGVYFLTINCGDSPLTYKVIRE